jgi:catechol 2,3-dioxygenase-like lactoylglutathione lyase family enzyme
MLKSMVTSAPTLAPGNADFAEPLKIERFGLYVLADDLDRATEFYAALFGLPPEVRIPALVGFGIGQGLFAIASRMTYAIGVQKGGGVRPYIKDADLNSTFQKVRTLMPDGPEIAGVVKEGAFSFFRFTDPEGNEIEFFSIENEVERSKIWEVEQ